MSVRTHFFRRNKMKKLFLVLMVLAVAFTAFAQGSSEAAAKTDAVAIAMVTDYGDITDQSFNQTTYEACKDYATAQGLKFQYFKPTGDSTAERVKSITQAIESGYNVIVMPGFAFGEAIQEVAPQYKDTKFIALDVSEFDLGGTVPANVYAAVYQEELAGYFAGYAAVKLGYTKLGYLGGMAVPAVVRYGYGFVQGADAAAAETGAKVEVKYTYGNQFFGDADITAAMDTWYKAGTECVFACGGGIYSSAAEAAAKVGGKVIGVDVDQAPIIDGAYGKGITVTSAMKGLYASTQAALKTIAEDNNWASLAGKSANLGLVSKDPELNYVGIPTGAGTQFSDKFTLDNYKALVADLLAGKIKVDNSIDVAPAAMGKTVTVIDLGTIK
jgi:basic membrane protein A